MTIAEPDPRWADLGRQACVVLAPLFLTIEHVGSTAVPGLPAKPVIDLMASLHGLDEINEGYADLMEGRNIRGVVMHQH